ncbi:MAG: metal-dependent transcriptional regulator [Planctomycetia bacterium]|nr:metal-dependent transcriptional regulator [Planctomycetia bacterium]
MNEPELTASLEDYLEAIYELSLVNQKVRSTDIAQKLNVKRPSVTNALQMLQRRELILYDPYSAVLLTEYGKKEAIGILRRHKTLQIFLEKILGIEKEKAQTTACRIEHAIDSEITTRLVEFIEFFESCPRAGGDLYRNAEYHCREKHNDRQCADCIAKIVLNRKKNDRSAELLEIHRGSCPLDQVNIGQSVLIVSMGKEKKSIQQLTSKGIFLKARADLVRRTKDGTVLEIKGNKILLDPAEARILEVLPCDPA